LKNPAPILGKLHNQTREVLVGTADDDTIYPGGGWDVVEGGSGIDTVVIIGRSSQFKLVVESGVTYIDALSGASAMTERAQLVNVELVQFLDKTVSLVVNDTFQGQPGTDFIDGGLGTDTVVYSGPIERYTVIKSGNRYIVSEPTGSDDTDYLTNIERLQFKQSKLALDITNGPVADGAKLIGALLGPTFVKDKALAGIVIGLMDQNYSAEDVATLGLATPLYLGMAGSANNVDFVKQVFSNVVGRPPLVNELNIYVGMLENGTATQVSLAVMAANTDLNAARIDLVGLIQLGWEFV
jgi:Ca2+-binding RTX toxin-like protein